VCEEREQEWVLFFSFFFFFYRVDGLFVQGQRDLQAALVDLKGRAVQHLAAPRHKVRNPFRAVLGE
jgi:hypothetical protein